MIYLVIFHTDTSDAYEFLWLKIIFLDKINIRSNYRECIMGFNFKAFGLVALVLVNTSVFAGGYTRTISCTDDRCEVKPKQSGPINGVDKSFFVAQKAQYVSLGIGIPYVNKVTKNSNEITGFHGFGGQIFLGMQFNQMIGPEIGFQYHKYNKFSSEVYITSAALRGAVHFNDRLRGFAKLGIGAGTVSMCSGGCSQKTHFVPVFGAGLGWSILPQWMLTTEFNAAYFDTKSDVTTNGVVGLLSIGVTRFIAW